MGEIFTGMLFKMKSSLTGNKVSYQLPLGEACLGLDCFLGKKIKFTFTEKIFCIETKKQIKKTYGQGYSYEAFLKLPECDSCMLHPEKCHYHEGTCRDPHWGEKNCFIPHFVYLSLTSGVKVGVTRERNTPQRWIDQGAVKALPILRVQNRKDAGIIECEAKKFLDDKTNWRKMLQGDIPSISLEDEKERLIYQLGDILDDLMAEEIESDVWSFEYPFILDEKFALKTILLL